MNSPFVSDGITENFHGFCLCRISTFSCVCSSFSYPDGIYVFVYTSYCIPYNVILTTRSSFVGRDSVDGIATRYGLEVPGIRSRWGRDFPHPSRQVLGSTQLPIQFVPGLYPGGKEVGAWCWPPTPSNAEVKERVELCLSSLSGP